MALEAQAALDARSQHLVVFNEQQTHRAS
jgi:hypothetical protein